MRNEEIDMHKLTPKGYLLLYEPLGLEEALQMPNLEDTRDEKDGDLSQHTEEP
jgi:hypothetical protein